MNSKKDNKFNDTKQLKISSEQKNVAELVKYANVIVDSVAGSGKTTTNIFIAQTLPDTNILLLTYNSKLKVETRERVKALGIRNIEIHSYHSFCVKYYNRKCFTDKIITKIVNDNSKSFSNFSYDIIVIDEAQDMTLLYYRLVNKIYKDNFRSEMDKIVKPCKICILGDKNQSIYAFNGADQRFITFGKKCFNWNSLPWKDCKLSVSFRTTQPNADFLNNCILGEERIKSIKPSKHKPKYIICNTFGNYNTFRNGKGTNKLRKVKPNVPSGNIAFDIIRDYLNKSGNKPSDVFILAPSIKSEQSPARKLENMIKQNLDNILVYVPTSDEEKIDASIIENKLVFSTFHQSKGLERKLVIVYGFDESYMTHFKKGSSLFKCPNELYVATTRALDQLVLLHHYQNDYLPFLRTSLLGHFSEFIEERRISLRSVKSNNTKVDVTQLTKHLKESVVTKCLTFFKIKNIKKIGKKIDIPIKSVQSNTKSVENVSEITGIAIPLYYEYLQRNKIKLLDKLSDDESITKHSEDVSTVSSGKKKTFAFTKDDDSGDSSDSDGGNDDIKKYLVSKLKENVKNKKLTPDEILYIANRWNTYKNGYLYKLDQIKDYNWLTKKDLTSAMKRLIKLNINSEAHFEYFCELTYDYSGIKYLISGFYDCYDYELKTSHTSLEGNSMKLNGLYEFKCVSKLKDEHYLQLAIYAYMDMTKRIEFYENIKRLAKLVQFIDNSNDSGSNSNDSTKGNKDDEDDKDDNDTSNDNPLKVLEHLKTGEINTGYYIYNILTGQKDKIIFKYDNLKKMMTYLIKEKYFSNNNLTDDEFISQIKKLKL